jgi:hypothetical protein
MDEAEGCDVSQPESLKMEQGLQPQALSPPRANSPLQRHTAYTHGALPTEPATPPSVQVEPAPASNPVQAVAVAQSAPPLNPGASPTADALAAYFMQLPEQQQLHMRQLMEQQQMAATAMVPTFFPSPRQLGNQAAYVSQTTLLAPGSLPLQPTTPSPAASLTPQPAYAVGMQPTVMLPFANTYAASEMTALGPATPIHPMPGTVPSTPVQNGGLHDPAATLDPAATVEAEVVPAKSTRGRFKLVRDGLSVL